MKDKFREIIKYRLQQADESLKDADILLSSGGTFRSVINRSNYGMFYSVLALIAKKGIGTSKHYGVLSLFDKDFVKPGIFTKEMSKLFHRSFHLRQDSDYSEFTIISKEETNEILDGAKEFVNRVKSHLAE